MGSFARIATHTVDLPAVLAGVAATTAIFGCDLAGTPVYTLAPVRDAVVVIGSEGRGLSAPVAGKIRQTVTIPRFGEAESLNAAVAAGIVCAQLRRPAVDHGAQNAPSPGFIVRQEAPHLSQEKG
jgi:RNA methyltransferase, TrmH family